MQVMAGCIHSMVNRILFICALQAVSILSNSKTKYTIAIIITNYKSSVESEL